MKSVYLLTGPPGTGKTSLIKQAIVKPVIDAGGFYTEEIRVRGIRVGFKLVTLDGIETVLSHIDFDKRFRVGKYGVDIEAMNEVGVAALRKAADHSNLVLIDEIGRMELLSTNFRDTVREIIDSGKRTLGTIMLNAHPYTDEIKRQPQVSLQNLTRGSYDRVLKNLKEWLADENYSTD